MRPAIHNCQLTSESTLPVRRRQLTKAAMKSAGAIGCTVTRARNRASMGACGLWATVEKADMAAVLTRDGKSRANLLPMRMCPKTHQVAKHISAFSVARMSQNKSEIGLRTGTRLSAYRAEL